MPTFRGKSCTDASLCNSPSIANWKNLSLQNGSVTAIGLKCLLQAEKLKELEIIDCSFTNEGMEVISHLPWLTSLLCHQVENVTDEGLVHLSKMTQLIELYLDDATISDAGIQFLHPLQQLTSASFNDTSITDTGIEAMSLLKGLDSLDLCGTRTSGTGFGSFSHKSLEHLWLSWCPLTSTGIKALCKSLPLLRTLFVDNSAVTDEDAKTISSLKNLETLNISKTRVSGEGVLHFAGHPHLEEIYVEGINIDSDTIDLLKKSSPRELVIYR